MAKIPDQHIEQLKQAGLFVSNPWPSNHVMADHVDIGKPSSVKGNSIPGFERSYGLERSQKFDAPLIKLFLDGDTWIVRAMDHSPVPGPGDFLNEWKTGEEAVEDILGFYFGSPERMKAKAEAKAK